MVWSLMFGGTQRSLADIATRKPLAASRPALRYLALLGVGLAGLSLTTPLALNFLQSDVVGSVGQDAAIAQAYQVRGRNLGPLVRSRNSLDALLDRRLPRWEMPRDSGYGGLNDVERARVVAGGGEAQPATARTLGDLHRTINANLAQAEAAWENGSPVSAAAVNAAKADLELFGKEMEGRETSRGPIGWRVHSALLIAVLQNDRQEGGGYAVSTPGQRPTPVAVAQGYASVEACKLLPASPTWRDTCQRLRQGEGTRRWIEGAGTLSGESADRAAQALVAVSYLLGIYHLQAAQADEAKLWLARTESLVRDLAIRRPVIRSFSGLGQGAWSWSAGGRSATVVQDLPDSNRLGLNNLAADFLADPQPAASGSALSFEAARQYIVGLDPQLAQQTPGAVEKVLAEALNRAPGKEQLASLHSILQGPKLQRLVSSDVGAIVCYLSATTSAGDVCGARYFPNVPPNRLELEVRQARDLQAMRAAAIAAIGDGNQTTTNETSAFPTLHDKGEWLVPALQDDRKMLCGLVRGLQPQSGSNGAFGGLCSPPGLWATLTGAQRSQAERIWQGVVWLFIFWCLLMLIRMTMLYVHANRLLDNKGATKSKLEQKIAGLEAEKKKIDSVVSTREQDIKVMEQRLEKLSRTIVVNAIPSIPVPLEKMQLDKQVLDEIRAIKAKGG